MKKLVPILLSLSLLFSFTACSDKVPELSQETFFFENTTWGMTKAETMKALKLKEKDFVLTKQERQTIDVYEVKDYNYGDTVCDLLISFTNDKSKTTVSDALSTVSVKFNDKPALENELKKCKEKFTEMKSGASGDGEGKGTRFTWNSTKTIKDYVVQNEIPIQEFFAYIMQPVTDMQTYTDEEILEMLDGKMSESYSLNLSSLTVHLNYNIDKDGYVGKITFDGSSYASVATFKK